MGSRIDEISGICVIVRPSGRKKTITKTGATIRTIRKMPQPTKQEYAKARNWKPLALVVCIVALVGFYLVSGDTDESAMPTGASTYETAKSTDAIQSRALSNIQEFDAGGGVEPPTPGSSRDADAYIGQNYLPDFLVDDIILLQAQQQVELEQMRDDLDAVVAVRDGDRETEVTLGELRSLQAWQQSEAESAFDDEIVIDGGIDGSAALTVADLRALHDKQHGEFESADLPDDIVIAGSTDGVAALTRVEIEALHARERLALDSDTSPNNLYPAPASSGDGNLTVDELKDLHDRQFQE